MYNKCGYLFSKSSIRNKMAMASSQPPIFPTFLWPPKICTMAYNTAFIPWVLISIWVVGISCLSNWWFVTISLTQKKCGCSTAVVVSMCYPKLLFGSSTLHSRCKILIHITNIRKLDRLKLILKKQGTLPKYMIWYWYDTVDVVNNTRMNYQPQLVI